MAALQGRGAFGGLDGGASTPPPKPATQKPKWKPPPVISAPADDTESGTPGSEAGETVKSPSPSVRKSSEDDSANTRIESIPTAEAVEEAEDQDPEEEERQRRAAIAARMARLGGARVGMAPPIFGKKPSIKKTDPPKDEDTQSLETKPTDFPSDREQISHVHFIRNNNL
jgi:hypothetical protein